MKRFIGILFSILTISLSLGGVLSGMAQAGEKREVVLKDGSVITGEVISLTNGIYTVKSDSLGVVKLEESAVRIIREKSAAGSSGIPASSGGTGGEVKSLQEKMVSDKEVMGLIQSLENDPEFKKVLEDPEIMKAVNAGDVSVILTDPRIMKILNNPTVQGIGKKIR